MYDDRNKPSQIPGADNGVDQATQKDSEAEASLWRRVRDDGDPKALKALSESIKPIDEMELGAGD